MKTAAVGGSNARYVKGGGGARLGLGLLGLVFIGVALLGIFDAYSLGNKWLTPQAMLIGLFIASYAALSYAQLRTFYLLSTAFIFVVCVFHVSFIFLHALGVADMSMMAKGPRGYWYQKAGWYVLLSLASFCVGAALARKRTIIRPVPPEQKALALAKVYWAGIGLTVASILMFALTWIQVGNIFRFSRAELFKGVGDTRGFGVFLMLFPTSAMLLVLGAQTKLQRLYSTIYAVIGTAFIMFLGYRFYAVGPLLVGAIMWRMLGRNIPRTLVIGGVFVLLVVIPAISQLRQMGSYQEISAADFEKTLGASSAEDTFLELGAIGGIVSHVIEWVPKEDPYRYGVTYIEALGNALPNLGGSTTADAREKFIHGGHSKSMLYTLGPSDWYIFKVNRWMFDNGGGGGFSVIAEAYLNFGVMGVILVLMLIGYLLSRAEMAQLHGNARLIMLLAAAIWPFFVTTRNEFSSFVKPASFIIISMACWYYATLWYSKPWRRRVVHSVLMSTKRRPV